MFNIVELLQSTDTGGISVQYIKHRHINNYRVLMSSGQVTSVSLYC